jgi:hypothetical protein
LRFIVQDIKRLLTRIEDAVPLINLAITTSGASLSTTLPATVSPSRLLQASTFLTTCDTRYSLDPNCAVQVGPTFTLSVYMLFGGHANRPHDERALRDMTWKEAIHKAKVKLMRVPLTNVQDDGPASTSFTSSTGIDPTKDVSVLGTIENDSDSSLHLAGEGKANEYSYQLLIIEDLDDHRLHTYEDNEPQPGPYEDVPLAGMRELFPIHQISKIFYADTGKILNIGGDGETNSPVLLLKRDVDALPPRRMMETCEREELWQEPTQGTEEVGEDEEGNSEDSESDTATLPDESQADIDDQLHRESTVVENESPPDANGASESAWRLPPDLDPEWVAFEVYSESADDSSSDEGERRPASRDSAYASGRPSSSHEPASEADITASLSQLDLGNTSIASSTPSRRRPSRLRTVLPTRSTSLFGPVRSSLSLLEMLIRLTALQQFQQASHLSIPDELLTFFLEESSTTGAGGDGEERRRRRWEARQKVGFDPYDESPIKHRGEEYQYQHQHAGSPARDVGGGSAFEGWDNSAPLPGRGWARERSATPKSEINEHWLLRDNKKASASSRGMTPDLPSSPASPLARTASGPLNRVRYERKGVRASPLGRGVSVETDSSLGTSPLSATLSGKSKQAERGKT